MRKINIFIYCHSRLLHQGEREQREEVAAVDHAYDKWRRVRADAYFVRPSPPVKVKSPENILILCISKPNIKVQVRLYARREGSLTMHVTTNLCLKEN